MSSSLTLTAAVLTTCHTVWRDIRRPRRRDEERLLVGTARPSRRGHRRPSLRAEPGVECSQRVAPDRHQALLCSLPVGQRQPPLHVEVAEAKARQLRDAHPGRVEGLEDRPVAQRPRIVADDSRQQQFDLGLRQCLRDGLGYSRRRHALGRIARRPALVDTETMEPADSGQGSCRRGGRGTSR